MPSPFPGMDPWLESPQQFGNLHLSMIAFLQEALQPRLPESYFARAGLRVRLEVGQRDVEPDVYVGKERADEPAGDESVVATMADTGPTMVAAEPEEFVEVKERYLDIIHLEGKGRRLVTSIEILSPSNKSTSGDGRALYLRKQRELRFSEANLVEIDLLRGGVHTTAVSYDRLVEKSPDFTYHVCVRCFDHPQEFFTYPFRLQDSLPPISIPLLPGDAAVTVELQPLFDRCYDVGAFAMDVDYANDIPVPPLTDEQQRWADEILRAAK